MGEEQEETWGTCKPLLGAVGGTEWGEVVGRGLAGHGMEQSQRQRTLASALAQELNQKGDYCFMAVLTH